MFQLNNHLMLTLYSILLYFIINYLCNNNKLSSKFMKMFNIKNKFVMKIVCLALFAITFYFISKGMIKQGFKVGGQQADEVPCNLPHDTIRNGHYSNDCLDQTITGIDRNGQPVVKLPHNTECDIVCNEGYTLNGETPTCTNGKLDPTMNNVECVPNPAVVEMRQDLINEELQNYSSLNDSCSSEVLANHNSESFNKFVCEKQLLMCEIDDNCNVISPDLQQCLDGINNINDAHQTHPGNPGLTLSSGDQHIWNTNESSRQCDRQMIKLIAKNSEGFKTQLEEHSGEANQIEWAIWSLLNWYPRHECQGTIGAYSGLGGGETSIVGLNSTEQELFCDWVNSMYNRLQRR